MKKFLRLFCLGGLTATCALLPPATAWADVKAGVDDWSNGNYEAAIREWQPLADRGDPDALFNLAQAYKFGRGVPEDPVKATELYGRAAEKGHVQAADIYGLLLFQSGQREKAMPYIKASAARGDPRAQYILGLAHFNGDLAEKDWIRAYALVSLAGQAGLPQAARALAQMDQHIPLADRQKSVLLSTQIAAEAEATRERMAASAELGRPSTVAAPPPRTAAASPPEIVSAERAVSEASRVAGSDSPASAGADYTRAAPPSAMAASPRPAPTPMHISVPATKPAATPKAAPATAPVTPASTSGPWRVQLGAFGVSGNAEALWAKVRGRPELAGHGKLLVPAGKLTKLQAGGFASKAAADAACARLSAGGFTCVAARD